MNAEAERSFHGLTSIPAQNVIQIYNVSKFSEAERLGQAAENRSVCQPG